MESAVQILAAFRQAEVLLVYFRKLLLEARDKGLLAENFDVDSLIPDMPQGTLGGTQPASAQSDHASAATATGEELQKDLKRLLHTVNCQDHVRTNMAEEGAKATNKLLVADMGEQEQEEFASERVGNLVDSII